MRGRGGENTIWESLDAVTTPSHPTFCNGGVPRGSARDPEMVAISFCYVGGAQPPGASQLRDRDRPECDAFDGAVGAKS